MLAATGWWVGLSVGFAVVAAVVGMVVVIIALAARIADQAQVAAGTLPAVREQTDALRQVGEINDSAVSILRSTRAARKALTGA
ncbi:MAG: hypothetical protein H0T43_04785 [Solirubrobacterales bacterium]|nr:hypothetical protein [Solirubrobacterales bacterium]